MKKFSKPLLWAALSFSLVGLVSAQNIDYVGSTLWSNMSDIKVIGDHIYGSFENGLLILDVSEPDNPVTIGQYICPEEGGGVIDVSVNYAYLTKAGSGLGIIDISNPSSPQLSGTYVTASYSANDIFADGNYVYVADGEIGGLQLIDVTDPFNPIFAGIYDTPGDARAVFISGNYAFVADGDSGLQIIDITDPSNPSLAGEYASSEAIDVFVIGNYAYVIDHYSGLLILEVSDPVNPVLVGDYYGGGGDDYAVYNGGFVTGNYACLTGEHCIPLGEPWGGYICLPTAGILDISDPSNPTPVGGFGGGNTEFSGDIDVSGNYLFAILNSGGFWIIDVSDVSYTVHVGTYSGADIHHVFVDGELACVASNDGPFHILDISDQTNPIVAGISETSFSVEDVSIASNYAYIVGDRLRMFDISNPSQPLLSGTSGSLYGVHLFLDGNYAYVAAGYYGLRIIDVSNPTNPTLTGEYPLEGTAYDVFVSGDYAYVGDWDTLQVINISDPSAPTLTAGYPIPSADECYVRHIDISGNHAYLNCLCRDDYNTFYAKLFIINISDPTNPYYVGEYNDVTTFMVSEFYAVGSVSIQGKYAYIADGFDGLQVIDISIPSSPSFVADYNTPGKAIHTFVDGYNIYVADETSLVLLESDFGLTCGDANGDGLINVGDPVFLINYIFRGGAGPDPVCTGDANGDSDTNVGDAVYLIAHIFNDGLSPAELCCQ
jgi:hypothetical protein